jgi:hypothetical protein
MLNNKFLQLLKSYVEQYQVKTQINKSIKNSEKLKNEFCDFLNHTEIKLKYDHNKLTWDQWIDDFTEKNIVTKRIKPNQNITLNFSLTYHFNDTWEKHNITKRFNKTLKFRIEKGSLLHLAAILGNKNMAIKLIEAGAEINKQDLQGKTPLDFLFKNDNYTSEKDYQFLKELLSQPKQKLRLVK